MIDIKKLIQKKENLDRLNENSFLIEIGAVSYLKGRGLKEYKIKKAFKQAYLRRKYLRLLFENSEIGEFAMYKEYKRNVEVLNDIFDNETLIERVIGNKRFEENLDKLYAADRKLLELELELVERNKGFLEIVALDNDYKA